MANDFSPSFKEVWAREQQTIFYKKNVFRQIGDMSFESQLKSGDTFHRTYRSSNGIQTYVRGSDITIDDKTDTDETLIVNKQFATGFYVDDFDAIQNDYDAAASYGKDDGVYLSNQMDADGLGEVYNAQSTVDDGTLGGTAGNGISLNVSNIMDIFSAAKKKLRKLNIPVDNGDLFAVCSPEMEETLIRYGAGKDTPGADKTLMNGFFGKFYGFDLYSSNQLAGSATLLMATQPGNGETVVINGVTFTAVSSIGTTAGNFLIGANVDVTRANLAALINAPGTTNANQVALSVANQRLFLNATATNDNTADTLLVKFKGVGVLTVTETLAAAADIWTVALQKQHNLFGAKGGTALIVQKEPRLVFKDEPKRHGGNVLNGILYGLKSFTDTKKKLVNVEIQSATF